MTHEGDEAVAGGEAADAPRDARNDVDVRMKTTTGTRESTTRTARILPNCTVSPPGEEQPNDPEAPPSWWLRSSIRGT
jgi:hypothetical protein